MSGAPNDRRMVYPYTLTAKIVRFPFMFYYKNSGFFRFYIWGMVASLPFFYKMQQLACSEANYVKYAEYLKKEELEIEKHKEHLL